MILFDRWIIARVDRAVREDEAKRRNVCNGWILTDQDDGYRCQRPMGHEGFCDPKRDAK